MQPHNSMAAEGLRAARQMRAIREEEDEDGSEDGDEDGQKYEQTISHQQGQEQQKQQEPELELELELEHGSGATLQEKQPEEGQVAVEGDDRQQTGPAEVHEGSQTSLLHSNDAEVQQQQAPAARSETDHTPRLDAHGAETLQPHVHGVSADSYDIQWDVAKSEARPDSKCESEVGSVMEAQDSSQFEFVQKQPDTSEMEAAVSQVSHTGDSDIAWEEEGGDESDGQGQDHEPASEDKMQEYVDVGCASAGPSHQDKQDEHHVRVKYHEAHSKAPSPSEQAPSVESSSTDAETAQESDSTGPDETGRREQLRDAAAICQAALRRSCVQQLLRVCMRRQTKRGVPWHVPWNELKQAALSRELVTFLWRHLCEQVLLEPGEIDGHSCTSQLCTHDKSTFVHSCVD